MARTRFPHLAACLLLACSACSNGKTETVTRIPLGNAPGAGGTSTGSGASPSTGGETTGAGGTGVDATGGTTSTGAGGSAGSGATTSSGGTGDGSGGMSAGGTGGGTGGMNTGGTGGTGVTGHFQMLVFSKTAGFRHTSAIEAGQVWVESVASANDFEITTTEDAAIFTDESLNPFQVIFFLNTTDDILDSAQQTAMENFIKKGRGFVGTHSATDTEDGFGWAWYQELVGSDYNGHGPANTPGTLTVDSGALNHPATKDLPQSWNRNEEWYLFKRDVSALSGVTVLLRFSEDDRPMAWTREWDGGRSFYTACGHDGAAFQEELFQKHLLGGILWAAGRVD